MITTKKFIVAFIVFLVAHLKIYAQYNGGNADGSSLNILSPNSCSTPANFFPYFGGSGDGEGVHTLINATCSTTPGQFAYMGGISDGESVNTKNYTTCGYAPGAYAYMGGNNDGVGLETKSYISCPYPPQFYAYFGGSGDGSSMNKQQNCAIVLPVADFTGNPLEICVNQNVTFTDASTNAVAWEWTVTGGTFVSPSTMYSQNPVVKYATAGTYAVTLKARNIDGDNIITKTAYIKVNATATITATTPNSRCGAGSVTISATPNSGTIKWYNAATGGTLLFTGNSFTTPSISTSTTYYAEAFNGCTASTRTAVIATVNTIPTITGNPASRCDAGSVTLGATPSDGTVSWYDAPTGGNLLSTGTTFTTPSLSTSTTYYAETVSSAGCTSTRIPVVATVNTTPTITSTTNATVCGNAGGTLYATANLGTIYWYSVASGGTAIQSGNSLFVTGGSYTFYAEANNNGCISARVPVTYTQIPNPQITSAPSVSRCGAGSVTLNATSDSGTITWYDASTGGNLVATGTSYTTPSLSSSTTYYLEVNNGTCPSLSRTPIMAVINYTSPPIGNSPQTLCGNKTLADLAVIGSNIIWYDAASGGNVLPSSTPIVYGTTYYASQTISGCESTVRLAITANNSGCLGTGEANETKISLYPNPVSEILNVQYDYEISKVEIYSMSGQKISTEIQKTNHYKIDMRLLPSAMYLLRVYSDGKEVKTYKVIKK